MKKLIFLIILNALFLIPNSFCSAQRKDIDSLLNLLKKDKEDTAKLIHLNVLAWRLRNKNPDTAIILCNQALNIITPISSAEFPSSKEVIEPKELSLLRARTLGNIGVFYGIKTDYNLSLDYSLHALKICEELKNKKWMAIWLGNIGSNYIDQGNYPKAIDYILKAQKINEELGNKRGIAEGLSNLGILYFENGDYAKSLEYDFKGLKIAEESGNKNTAVGTLINIASVYKEERQYTKALNFYFNALKMAEELGNETYLIAIYGNVGLAYNEQKDYSKALNYYFKSLKLAETNGNRNYQAIDFANIGVLYTKIGKFKEAEQYLQKAIFINDSIKSINDLMDAEEYIYRLYDTTERYKQALIHYKKSISLKDTLFSQENKKQLIRKEMNYEFDKKEAATKAENEKQQAVAEAESKKQKIIICSVIGGLLLVIVFASFVFRSLRITRKQKNIIELQKNEVDKQKEIVEKQKEKIVDSITYAQRIQQSILMEESEVQNFLPECFIYFQPKDIVSGDFYWCSKIDDKIIIAAVDCTGHGVPGAFMSMIGNTLLNQIVNEKHITKPSEILHYLNLGVYEALHQKKDGALSDDGMDIALCYIDHKNNEVQYAGQNPLYILLDGKIEVIKGDIYGIGGGGMIAKLHDPLKKVFANHVIPIKEGMSIYLSTDGYMDQFGGSERKKFGAQRFKDLLSNNLHLNMQQQKELMVSAHAEWKGNTPQIDDVLVIGIRL